MAGSAVNRELQDKALVITRVTHKVHACCGHLFPVIDAALALRQALDIRVQDVVSVQATTYRAALEATGRLAPRTAYECKFSMPYVLAHALKHGAVGLDAFGAERMADGEIRALMARCVLRADDRMSAEFPARRPAALTITLTDGRVVSHQLSVQRGDSEAPLTDAELGDKFRVLAMPVIGQDRAERLLADIWSLETRRLRDLRLYDLDQPTP